MKGGFNCSKAAGADLPGYTVGTLLIPCTG